LIQSDYIVLLKNFIQLKDWCHWNSWKIL